MTLASLPDTIPELLKLRAEASPYAVASQDQGTGGGWVPSSWAEYSAEVLRLASAFRGLGLVPGDRLAIVAHTRREWHLAELAGLAVGAAIVGIDPHASSEQARYVIDHAGVSCLIADGAGNLNTIGNKVLASLKFVVAIDPPAADAPYSGAAVPWTALAAGSDPEAGRFGPVRPDDTATLIYTSGTTGAAKGIEYSHRKLMAGCRALVTAYSELAEGEAFLCWLPMAHLYQRMMNLLAIAHGMTIYYVEQPQEVLSVSAVANPAFFFAVPRFYEKLAERVQEASDRRSALQQLLGRKLKYSITGAAPIPRATFETLHEAGLPLLEAYGVSENPVPVATNLPHAFRIGSVGRAFPSNEVRLAEDGEVLVRGPALFEGYYRDPASSHCFTDDGYYKTGDLGRLDAEGFLFLEGRKAELIKTSTGRRIAPARIEAVYGESPYLDQVVVFGHGRKYLVALVTVNIESIAADLRLPPSAELPRRPEVRDCIRREIDAYGERLAPYERISAFAILEQPLSVAKGELTHTLKLRRRHIETHYAALIDGLYDADRPPRETRPS